MNKQKFCVEKNHEPPERIYHWLHTQLSVARFFGGLKYQGHDYKIATHEEGQPLVRVDVLRREALANKAIAKDVARVEKETWIAAQGVLL